MPAAQIRPALPTDVPQLVALMTEFYAESGFPLPAAAAVHTFDQLLRDPRLGTVWLLHWAGEPAGFVVLTVNYSMEYGGLRGFIDDFFVRPAYRRRGLGGLALQEVKRACIARGVRALLVEVAPDNAPAQSAYRRLGLADSGRQLLSLTLAPPVHAAWTRMGAVFPDIDSRSGRDA